MSLIVWWKRSIAVSNVASSQLRCDDLEAAGSRATSRLRLRVRARLCETTVSHVNRLRMRSGLPSRGTYTGGAAQVSLVDAPVP